MRYVRLNIKPRGANRAQSHRVEVSKDETRGDTRIITGTKVNKEGEGIHEKAGQEDVHVFIGVGKVVELVSDWKYGELVPAEKATQNTNPEWFK